MYRTYTSDNTNVNEPHPGWGKTEPSWVRTPALPFNPFKLPCMNDQHYPPSHMVFPDNGYLHVCPGCGETYQIYPTRVTC